MIIDLVEVASKALPMDATIYVRRDDCLDFLQEAESQGGRWSDMSAPLSYNPAEHFDASAIVFYVHYDRPDYFNLSFSTCEECPDYVQYNYSDMLESVVEIACESLNLDTIYP